MKRITVALVASLLLGAFVYQLERERSPTVVMGALADDTATAVDLSVWPESINPEPEGEAQFYAGVLMSNRRTRCQEPPVWSGVVAGGCDSAVALLDMDKASCCRTCIIGKACGHSCIARWRECHQPPGCAC